MEQPLAGLRVLELGNMYAAPTAGRMLLDFGAEVIKVEEPTSGDTARTWVPQHDGLALGFARLNAGKRSIAVDLRSPEGREIILELAAKVDVVIESFRPGRLEAWGMGLESLSAQNAGLVLVRVSGFGQTGPYRERPGFGTVAEALSGYAFLNGWPDTPPTSPPFGFADSIAGITAALGAVMGVLRRERTGQGGEVDVALYEPLMFILGDAILRYSTSGEIMQRQGNTTGAASPRGIYQTADGKWLCIAASSQSIAMRLFDAMNRPELKADSRFATNAARLSNNDELQRIVTDYVRSRPRAEALRIFEEHEVVAAAVNDASDIVTDPHFMERTLTPLLGSALGDVLVPGPILHMGTQPRNRYVGVPQIGEHTDEVLRDVLGLSDERMGQLRESGAIAGAASLPRR